MDHAFSTILADIAILLLVLFLPVLWILFSDRFRQNLDAQQYTMLFAIAGLAGILLRVPAITIICATALLGLGMAWLAARYALAGVS